jgi:hypothetical protein
MLYLHIVLSIIVDNFMRSFSAIARTGRTFAHGQKSAAAKISARHCSSKYFRHLTKQSPALFALPHNNTSAGRNRSSQRAQAQNKYVGQDGRVESKRAGRHHQHGSASVSFTFYADHQSELPTCRSITHRIVIQQAGSRLQQCTPDPRLDGADRHAVLF